MIASIPIQQRYVLGITLFLALTFCLTCFYAGQQWHHDWRLTHPTLSAPPPLIKTDETSKLIAALPNDHLFGSSFTNTGETPITALQLRVTGIVKITTEGQPLSSKAYLSISGKPSNVFQVGDSIGYGVTIYAITQDTVILENHGHLEKLPLPRETLHFKPRDDRGS